MLGTATTYEMMTLATAAATVAGFGVVVKGMINERGDTLGSSGEVHQLELMLFLNPLFILLTS